MIRIFDDNIVSSNKKIMKKLYLTLGLSFGLSIIFSVVFILFRQSIGPLLALVLGIITSSLGLIIFFEALFAGVLVIKKHERLVLMLLKNEQRAVGGIVTNFDNTIEYHHGEPFRKLSVTYDNLTLELYFWANSRAAIPEINSKVNLSLSENIIMGYVVL